MDSGDGSEVYRGASGSFKGLGTYEGEISMAVLIRHRGAMSPAQYDEISPPLVEQVRTPGVPAPRLARRRHRLRSGRVWETQEQHDTRFDANVKPNVPFEISQAVIALHSVHTP
jgi:hypothetical protein